MNRRKFKRTLTNFPTKNFSISKSKPRKFLNYKKKFSKFYKRTLTKFPTKDISVFEKRIAENFLLSKKNLKIKQTQKKFPREKTPPQNKPQKILEF